MIRLALLLLLFLVGCGSSPQELPEVQSSWGRIYNIAQDPQADAPAFARTETFTAFAWVGSDERGVHHDVRILTTEGLSPAAALPLSPVSPSAFQLLPTAESGTLLFYLDANPEGESRLYSAVFDPTLMLIAGPTLISHLRTEAQYTVSRAADGSLWVVWSGGSPAEPTLFAQSLDPLGRPRPPQQLVIDSTYPILRENADETLALYWLRSEQVYRARFEDGTIADTSPIAPSPGLERGERRVNFSVGQDSTTVYLFLNTVLADGTPRTWYATDGGETPMPLRISENTGEAFITGYNGGTGKSAAQGEVPVAWVSPVDGVSDPLPVAAQVEDQLSVVYLSEGQIIGYQPVHTLARDLLGLPMIATDVERHLYLSWSEPADTPTALLRFTSTRAN
jgi:hypothetical protein